MKALERFKRFFIFISIVFILTLIVIYSYRLIYFYKLEIDSDKNEENYFTDKLEKTINVSDTNGGLYIIEEEYIYKNNATDNYLWYSGQLWRILKINEDKTIDIVMDDSLSLLNVSFEKTNYIESYLNDFYQKLDNEFLLELNYCNDLYDNIDEIKCENKINNNITLLDIYTYNEVGGNSSFLNNGISFWLINETSTGNNWYVNTDGSLSIGEDINSFGIRPVVRLKSEIELISGSGTKEDPYIIKNKSNESLNVGEYVKFNNDLWRIINLTDDGITISKEECLKKNNECVLYNFGNSSIFDKSELYNYLNSEYYNSILNKEFIIKSSYGIGDYINYNYKNTGLKTVDAFVGINKIGDYYLSSKLNTYLLTANDSQGIYSINENGNYYLTFTNEQKVIYPILTLDINLKITGDGTVMKPYELSR